MTHNHTPISGIVDQGYFYARGTKVFYSPPVYKNTDGSKTYSLRFPALDINSDLISPDILAQEVALKLNVYDELLEALESALDNIYSQPEPLKAYAQNGIGLKIEKAIKKAKEQE